MSKDSPNNGLDYVQQVSETLVNTETKEKTKKLQNEIKSILDYLNNNNNKESLQLVENLNKKIDFLLENKQSIPTTIFTMVDSLAKKLKANILTKEAIQKIFLS